ncbi:hypothetical protein [Sphingomicrobium sediminis]|uniref:Uncharacterized protein n=1 Tax=Sphingomicrobium sediminis TaxID=2950949 RepID=A0A9X2EIC0_9SPHN|nr:hypothetical protein [Sphingomicrobium sediminis]MCM8557296.1 hypothetical protein [Sphingomicrobium sediminis]
MKKLVLLAGALTLAACNNADSAADEAPAEDMAMEADDGAAEEESMAGTYEVTWPDGSTSVTTVSEDMTWSAVGEDGETVSGTISENEEGQTCFAQDGSDEAPRCWTNSEAAEDGSWQSTDQDGTTITVRRTA